MFFCVFKTFKWSNDLFTIVYLALLLLSMIGWYKSAVSKRMYEVPSVAISKQIDSTIQFCCLHIYKKVKTRVDVSIILFFIISIIFRNDKLKKSIIWNKTKMKLEMRNSRIELFLRCKLLLTCPRFLYVSIYPKINFRHIYA